MKIKDYQPIKGKDYEILEQASRPFMCLNCEQIFTSQYYPKEYQSPGKIWGTKQILALWAWYNFKRHLAKCSVEKLKKI